MNISDALPKIERPNSLKDIAFKTLKESIINGSLISGEIYSENVISKKMEISKTPVHEALLELSHRGFIEILPKKGFLVKELTKEEIRDIYGFRLALEKVIFINAAEVSRKKDVIFLESILDKLKSCKDVMKFMEETILFHRYLAHLNDNEQIIRALNGIWDLCIWIGFKALSPDDLNHNLDRHFAMLNHIKNKDPKAAETSIETHIHDSLDLILKAIFDG